MVTMHEYLKFPLKGRDHKLNICLKTYKIKRWFKNFRNLLCQENQIQFVACFYKKHFLIQKILSVGTLIKNLVAAFKNPPVSVKPGYDPENVMKPRPLSLQKKN